MRHHHDLRWPSRPECAPIHNNQGGVGQSIVDWRLLNTITRWSNAIAPARELTISQLENKT